METNYLFPHGFKKIGWITAPVFAIILILYLISPPWEAQPVWSNFPGSTALDMIAGNNTIPTIAMVLLVVSLLFIAFSREKQEDEYIAKIRGDSLIWAAIANSVFVMVSSALIYNGWFLYVCFLNLYTMLILFVIKFNIALHKLRKTGGHEK